MGIVQHCIAISKLTSESVRECSAGTPSPHISICPPPSSPKMRREDAGVEIGRGRGREGTRDKHMCTQRLAPCAFICYLTDTTYDVRCGIPVLIYHLYQFVPLRCYLTERERVISPSPMNLPGCSRSRHSMHTHESGCMTKHLCSTR